MVKKIAIAVLLTALIGSAVFAEYDKNTTVSVMRQNAALMGQLSQAASAKDYYKAAAALVKIAEGTNRLLEFTPPKGSKAQWDTALKQFLDAVYKGIGACGDKNSARLDAAVKEIQAEQQKSHSMFR